MSLRAHKLNGNGSNMFVLSTNKAWVMIWEFLDEFRFVVNLWTNFGLNLLLLMRGKIKPEYHISILSNYACIGVLYKKLWLF
jgi:hypothetical protein